MCCELVSTILSSCIIAIVVAFFVFVIFVILAGYSFDDFVDFPAIFVSTYLVFYDLSNFSKICNQDISRI